MVMQKKSLSKNQFERDLTEFISKHGLQKLQSQYGKLFKGDQVTSEKVEVETPSYQELKEGFLQRIKDTKFKQTYRTYSSEMKHFGLFTTYKLPDGLNSKITEVMNPAHVSDYLSVYTNYYTWNKKAAVFRSFLKNECSEHLEKKRVKHLLEILKTQDPKEQDIPKAFTAKQVQFLLNETKNTQAALRNYAMVWTFLGTGIRNMELVNIQIGDISENNQTIKVIPKGLSTKVKRYISKVALQVLLHYINFRYEEQKKTLPKEKYNELYVFSTDGNKPFSRDTVRDIVDRLIKAGEKQGVFQKDNDFSPHTFRHTFAVYALEKGISIYKIKEYLGHKSIKSTEIYLELFDSQMVNAIEKHPFAQLELSFLKQKGDVNEYNA